MSDWFPTFQAVGQKLRSTPIRDLFRWQLSGRLNWKKRLASSGLSQPSQDLITDVIAATRLWRTEKADIAEELIDHFEAGIAKGTSEESLIKNFGDTQKVASLMKIAKKRNRSVFWKGFVATGYLLAGLFICYLGLAIWFFSGKPSPAINYGELMAAKPRSIPPEQRGWPIYRETWTELSKVSNFHHQQPGLFDFQDIRTVLKEPEDKTPTADSEAAWQRTVEFLNANQSLVEGLRKAAEKPGFGLELKRYAEYSIADGTALVGEHFAENASAISNSDDDKDPLDDALIGYLLPHAQLLRSSARILFADAIRAAENDDSQTVTDNILAIANMGPQIAETEYLVAGLVGIAIERQAYDLIETVLTEHPKLLSDEQLQTIASAISRIQPRGLLGYGGELAFQKDLIQRIYTNDGSGNGRLTSQGIKILVDWLPGYVANGVSRDGLTENFALVAGPLSVLGSASRKQIEQMFESVADRMTKDFGSPIYERPLPGDNWFDEQLAQLPSTDIAGKSMLAMLLPAVAECRIAGETCQAQRNATLIAIAADRFRIRNDEFPESVDDLVPLFLNAVPVDPLTGIPLKLSLRKGTPVVYSVGVDGIDQNGARAKPGLRMPLQMEIQQHFRGDIAMGDMQLWPTK